MVLPLYRRHIRLGESFYQFRSITQVQGLLPRQRCLVNQRVIVDQAFSIFGVWRRMENQFVAYVHTLINLIDQSQPHPVPGVAVPMPHLIDGPQPQAPA